ncbi:MAG: hypothetical protein RL077_90, partial [Verrucomicrobiota bacterium]
MLGSPMKIKFLVLSAFLTASAALAADDKGPWPLGYSDTPL